MRRFLATRDEPCHAQEQSFLFNAFPTEIRFLIYEHAVGRRSVRLHRGT